MPAVLAIILANIIWGAAPPVFKYALQEMPPFTLAFIRFFFAGIIFLPFFIRDFPKIKGIQLFHIVMGGFWGISVNVAFFFLGLKLSPSINVPIIGTTGPIILYICSLFILKEKPHPQVIKGMLIAVLGTVVIVFAPFLKSEFVHQSQYTISSQILGNLFFIVAMLGSVFMILHTKKISAQVSPVTITGIQFFVGAISFFPFMLNELQSWSFTSITYSGWVGVIYGIFFSSALGYFLMNYALKKLYAQEIGVFNYINPVIAVLIAIPLLGEYPDIFFIIGSTCVLVGMIISERHPHLKRLRKKLHHR